MCNTNIDISLTLTMQSKGLTTQHVEEDRAEVERLQLRVLEETQRARHLENALEDKEQELHQMREVSFPSAFASICFLSIVCRSCPGPICSALSEIESTQVIYYMHVIFVKI